MFNGPHGLRRDVELETGTTQTVINDRLKTAWPDASFKMSWSATLNAKCYVITTVGHYEVLLLFWTTQADFTCLHCLLENGYDFRLLLFQFFRQCQAWHMYFPHTRVPTITTQNF